MKLKLYNLPTKMGQSQQGKDMNTNSSNSLQVVSQSLLLWHGQLILLLWHQHPS